MARKNRVSIPDGTYHVTSRIANKEMWLKDPELKNKIVSWIYGIAAFSGVELLAWAVLDNHFHLVVHIPRPPKVFWSNLDESPESHAFGMRPPENRPSLWEPTAEDKDRPSPSRPVTGFMLSDEEMLERLGHLYDDPRRIDTIRKNWVEMRKRGNGGVVDAIKERYCRRMYNLSQFVKTLKERIAQVINTRYGHVGHVFEGRFYSGLLEDDGEVRQLVSLYVDYNPYKAGLVHEDENYFWSSFGQARGNGRHADSCRAAYERIHGCTWMKAQERIETAFRERMAERSGSQDTLAQDGRRVTPGQLIHLRVHAVSRGAFIGRRITFGREVTAGLTKNFPHPSFKSLHWLMRTVAWGNDRHVA